MKIYTDEELTKLIPKHKNDFSNIEELRGLPQEEFRKIGLEILEWFQDINWPIAREIRDLIILKQDVMTQHILKVLDGDDEWWKYWIVTNIVSYLNQQNLEALMPKLYDMFKNPTDAEKREDVTTEIELLLKEIDEDISGRS